VRSVQNAERIFRDGLPADIEAMRTGTPLEPIVHQIASRARQRKRRSDRPPHSIVDTTPRSARLICGNALDELRKLADNSIDACVCDPPYGMGMGAWDADLPSPTAWLEVCRVLKPGAWC